MLRFVGVVKRGSLTTVAMAVAAVYVSVPVLADTKIHATVCDKAGASIELDSPRRGTTVTQPEVTLVGTTHQVSEITIYLDDQYDGTLAIDQDQQNFSTSIQLAVGRHTIRLDANDICQIHDASVTTDVVYAPPAAGVGTGTGTSSSTPNVSSPEKSSNIATAPSPQGPSPDSGVFHALSGVILPPLKALDIVPANSNSLSLTILGHVIGMIAACTLMVFGWPGLTRRLLALEYAVVAPGHGVRKSGIEYAKVQVSIRLMGLALFALMLIL